MKLQIQTTSIGAYQMHVSQQRLEEKNTKQQKTKTYTKKAVAEQNVVRTQLTSS